MNLKKHLAYTSFALFFAGQATATESFLYSIEVKRNAGELAKKRGVIRYPIIHTTEQGLKKGVVVSLDQVKPYPVDKGEPTLEMLTLTSKNDNGLSAKVKLDGCIKEKSLNLSAPLEDIAMPLCKINDTMYISVKKH